MINKMIYIHPGYPKTATSLIQRKFFSTHPKINNLGKKQSINDMDENLLNVFRQIMFEKEIDENGFMKIKKVIDSIKYDSEKINLISFETFTQANFEVSVEKIFKRIKKIFYECNYHIKILVTIRSQLTMIPSHYANTSKVYKSETKRWESFKNFINDLQNIDQIEEKRLLVAYDRFKYFKLLKTLTEIFSESNVKFFLYEDLLKNQKNFFDDLAQFFKIQNHLSTNVLKPINVTRKKNGELKRINKYHFKNFKFVPKFLKDLKPSHKEFLRKFFANFFLDLIYFFDPIKLNDDQKKIVLNYYKDDNELLGRFLNKDLKSLGY